MLVHIGRGTLERSERGRDARLIVIGESRFERLQSHESIAGRRGARDIERREDLLRGKWLIYELSAWIYNLFASVRRSQRVHSGSAGGVHLIRRALIRAATENVPACHVSIGKTHHLLLNTLNLTCQSLPSGCGSR